MTTTPSADAEPPLSLGALLVLCLVAPVGGMALTGMSPVMPLIGAEFASMAGSEILVRLMMSGLSAAMILGALLSGVLADRIGQVRLLVISLTIYAISGSAIFLLDDLYLMVLCRVVQGVAIAAAGVLAMALITTRVPPARRDTWLGFYMVAGTAGILLLFTAIAAIAELGWRYTFLLFLLALPLALMLIVSLSDQTRGKQTAGEAISASLAQKPPVPWGLAAFGVLCGAIASASPMFFPYHLADLGIGDPGTIAMMMVGGAAAAGVTTLCFGLVRRRFSAIQVFVFGFSLNGVALMIQAFANGPAMILLGMVAAGIGLGILMPNVFSACAGATRAEWRARMLGFVRAGFYAGPLLAQPVLEVIYRHSSAGMTLLAIAVASFGGVVWVLFTVRQFDPVAENFPMQFSTPPELAVEAVHSAR